MNNKKPYCVVVDFQPHSGISCLILGVRYHFDQRENKFSIYSEENNEWVPMTPAQQDSKARVCQVLRDRFKAAEDWLQRSHHNAETRRIRTNRGQRRAFSSH